jgi:hypothetical protein
VVVDIPLDPPYGGYRADEAGAGYMPVDRIARACIAEAAALEAVAVDNSDHSRDPEAVEEELAGGRHSRESIAGKLRAALNVLDPGQRSESHRAEVVRLYFEVDSAPRSRDYAHTAGPLARVRHSSP